MIPCCVSSKCKAMVHSKQLLVVTNKPSHLKSLNTLIGISVSLEYLFCEQHVTIFVWRSDHQHPVLRKRFKLFHRGDHLVMLQVACHTLSIVLRTTYRCCNTSRFFFVFCYSTFTRNFHTSALLLCASLVRILLHPLLEFFN